MTDSYFFHCHGCGKCCNGSLSLTISESISYYQDFILGGTLRLEPKILSGIPEKQKKYIILSRK